MDRVLLGADEIKRLLKWRDEHKDLVRLAPAPLKAVEIVMEHNDFRIKGFRDGQILKLHLNSAGKSLGSTVFQITASGTFVTVPGKDKMKVDKEGHQSVLTIYCSLMALMAFGAKVKTDAPAKARNAHTLSQKKSGRRPEHITWVLRTENCNPCIVLKGSHASPSGEFSVRGHFRHYKSGKVVWINEYRKGTGKKTKKTYKLGGAGERG